MSQKVKLLSIELQIRLYMKLINFYITDFF